MFAIYGCLLFQSVGAAPTEIGLAQARGWIQHRTARSLAALSQLTVGMAVAPTVHDCGEARELLNAQLAPEYRVPRAGLAPFCST